MEYYYELIKTDLGVPLKVLIQSTNKMRMHLHKYIEILFVLEGSINIGIEDAEYSLEQGDSLFYFSMFNSIIGGNGLIAYFFHLYSPNLV